MSNAALSSQDDCYLVVYLKHTTWPCLAVYVIELENWNSATTIDESCLVAFSFLITPVVAWLFILASESIGTTTISDCCLVEKPLG
jgi:hypothetical protein